MGSGLGILMYLLSVLFNSPQSSYLSVYKWIWVASKPTYAVLMFCVLAEVYTRIVEKYQGLHRLGQVFMWAASGSAGLLFLAMSVLGGSPDEWLAFWHIQERSIYAALSVFSVLLILFSLHFCLAVSGNLRIVFMVFAVSATCSALVRTAADLGLLDVSLGGTQLNSFIYLVFVSFAVLRFSAVGEHNPRPLPLPESLRVASEAQVTQGLVDLNQQLTRILRS
ncbi:MAG: hypothetical protein O2968_06615 [Acidobacteria bacterium]|nr:hypothetical protein [Acidobacteriota bacterium]